jgi:hypothetical protein
MQVSLPTMIAFVTRFSISFCQASIEPCLKRKDRANRRRARERADQRWRCKLTAPLKMKGPDAKQVFTARRCRLLLQVTAIIINATT